MDESIFETSETSVCRTLNTPSTVCSRATSAADVSGTTHPANLSLDWGVWQPPRRTAHDALPRPGVSGLREGPRISVVKRHSAQHCPWGQPQRLVAPVAERTTDRVRQA